MSQSLNPHWSRSSKLWTKAVVIGLGGLFLYSKESGEALNEQGRRILLAAPPLSGRYRDGFDLLGVRSVLTILLMVSIVVMWPRFVARLGLSKLALASTVCCAAWCCFLAVIPTSGSLTAPLLTRYEYLPFARTVGSFRDLIDHYASGVPKFPTHVAGHPPGLVLVFGFLDFVLRSDLLIAVAVIVLGASCVGACVAITRRVAGDSTVRSVATVAPFAPFVLWVATSADALIAAAVVWSVYFAVGFAFPDPRARRARIPDGVRASLLAGAALCCSYGAAVLLTPTWCLLSLGLYRCQRDERKKGAIVVGMGLLALPVGLAVLGFDWLGAFEATKIRYSGGVAATRPAGYFITANLAAFAIATGVALAFGLVGYWPTIARASSGQAMQVIFWSGLAAVALADLSGFSKGEVERIWLPVTILVASMGAACVPRVAHRWVLASGLMLAFWVQVAIITPW